MLIGGFIVTGTQPKEVIVRAIGPSLPVAGNLADPTLELRDSNRALLAANDNWRSDQEAAIKASGVPPHRRPRIGHHHNLDGSVTGLGYTAIVQGNNGTTGVALVEVYAIAP